MSLPADYWESYEEEVSSLSGFTDVLESLVETWPGRRFVWRGVADSSKELHSSLYRRVFQRRGPVVEKHFKPYEIGIFNEARSWPLQRTATDRLSGLELLAALQHQRVPTRLLDFTHNAFVGLWFAVEQHFDDRGVPRPDVDGRLFCAEMTQRELEPAWERLPVPFWLTDEPPDDWLVNLYVWTPPPIDPRMARQQGCFVVAGIPSTTGVWNIRQGGATRQMRAQEIRSCVSIPFRLNTPHYIRNERAAGRRPTYPLGFTFRIPAGAKQALRQQLERSLGFTHAMMYPDYPGFKEHAVSILRP